MAGRWAAADWLIGVLLLALRTLVSSLRVSRSVRRALRRGEPRPELVRLLDESRKRLGVQRPVRIVECDAVRAPALHGLLRPTLLLPPGLAASFGEAELRHVIVHELWHLRRFDVGVSWLLSVVQTLHWFNPFVWFAASRIQEERELACDELALSCLEEEERPGYGRTILKLLERFRVPAPVPALVGIVNHKRKMKRRLLMIASFRDRSRFSILFLAVAGVIGAAGLTDARGGERQVLVKLDPAAMATMKKLDQRVSFELNGASLGELLNAVANKTGVAITQSPELAVLMESLMPFSIVPTPDANGITLAKGNVATMTLPAAGEPGEHKTFAKRVVVMHTDDKTEAEGAVKELDGEALPGEANPQVILFHADKGGPDVSITPGGKVHRELTINVRENGVESKGKLTIDIAI